jgi:4'-phosphopantetheinyl transferase
MRSPAADRPPLRDGEIHVWLARLVEDENRAAELVSLLDPEEAARAARFSYPRLRAHFVQSHAIVRRILAGYAGAVDAAGLVFERGRHGKPRVVAPAAGSCLHFSLSHSGDCCILAVRRGHPLGIDLERLRDVPTALEISRRNFTAAETRILAGLRGAARCDGFFAMWTCKEAVIKAMGTSLATSLGRVEVELDTMGHPRLASLGGNRSRAREWVVLRLDPTPGYAAALATPHPFRRLRHFVWHEAMPAVARDHENSALSIAAREALNWLKVLREIHRGGLYNVEFRPEVERRLWKRGRAANL